MLSPEDLQRMLEAAAKKAISEFAGQKKTTLLSREATAKRLHVDPSTLWRWRKMKLLSPIKIGGRVYYREEDVIHREGGEFFPEY